jgi:ATP-dependent DNA helicase DinG
MQSIETVAELAPDFVRLYERFSSVLLIIRRFEKPCPEESVRWLEVGMQLRLIESPLDIADAVQTQLLGRKIVEDSNSIEQAFDDVLSTPSAYRKAFVFTSATLGDDPQMKWFTEPCGLMQARLLQVSSPFDYAVQSGVYVPRQMPRPNDASHSRCVSDLVGPAALKLGGRTLVLTTTLAAMRNIGQLLSEDASLSGQVEVLVQGQGPKRRLMERFRQGDQDGQLGCILVASASFWEGFDVPGEALQLVVIDKLPFPPPNDPLVEARCARLERGGRSAFAEYSLPEAAVALKQGAGRLIRSESDQGILVVCDPRLATMGYGKRLLASLPAMRVLQTSDEFEIALDRLTKTSTKL